jgi:nitroreductase
MTLAPERVMDVIHQRRSVRAYEERQPSASLVRELLEAAVHAPTAMHREPWGFAIVQDRGLLKRWSNRAKAMLRAAPEAVGWGSSALLHGTHPAMLDDPAFNVFYDAGTLIVVCRREDSPFADADCWLAAQNLMLAATARGLGSCCIGFAVRVLNTTEARRELGIPEQGAAVAPIIVGYARGSVAGVPRKAPDILSWSGREAGSAARGT